MPFLAALQSLNAVDNNARRQKPIAEYKNFSIGGALLNADSVSFMFISLTQIRNFVNVKWAGGCESKFCICLKIGAILRLKLEYHILVSVVFTQNTLDLKFGIGLIVLLLALSAFFSASETAINSLSPAKVRTFIEEKRKGAHHLDHLKKKYHRTLIAILVANNAVNLSASTIATILATQYFNSAMIGIVTGILTLAVIIFGEILPKSFAAAYPEIALLVASPIHILAFSLTPLIWLLDHLVNWMLALFGNRKQKLVTDEELIAMASIGAEEGSINKQELELIENALEFNDIRAEEIMTPRIHMDALPETYFLDEATEFVVNHTHTRIPVYRENMDHIVGILPTKVLLKAYHKAEDPSKISLRQIDLLTPLKMPAGVKIETLFRKFKKNRHHLAILMDEFGGTAGLVTMEDLLEELVGDIEDEQDLHEANFRKLSKNEYELSGRMELDEIAELTGLEFEHPEYKTVSFLIMDALGHLPNEGESVTIKKWRFTVQKMLRSTILKVHLKKY